mmetsp:Transcript_33624/g.76033  ORF Transcript_33624/g.76033 Transcript_33624/m.76033 type:complete len:233 (-) Transcript_33624:31-729(-)
MVATCTLAIPPLGKTRGPALSLSFSTDSIVPSFCRRLSKCFSVVCSERPNTRRVRRFAGWALAAISSFDGLAVAFFDFAFGTSLSTTVSLELGSLGSLGSLTSTSTSAVCAAATLRVLLGAPSESLSRGAFISLFAVSAAPFFAANSTEMTRPRTSLPFIVFTQSSASDARANFTNPNPREVCSPSPPWVFLLWMTEPFLTGPTSPKSSSSSGLKRRKIHNSGGVIRRHDNF